MPDVSTVISAVGIDLGDRDASYAMVDGNGKVVEEGRIALTPTALRQTFGSLPEETPIAVEAGAQTRWVVDVLEQLGHEVVIANPRQLQLITASNSKNDANDAKLLAKLVRVDPDLLSPIELRDSKHQAALLSIRARAQLVKSRVALMQSVRGMLKSFAGVRLPRATSESFLERCRAAVPAELLPHLDGMLQIIQKLTQEIAVYDERIEQIAAAEYPEVSKLREVPGIGTLTALTFVVTIADPQRFASSRTVGAYLGLRPRQQQSGDRNPQLGITKAGDGYLRKLLVQSAHCVLSVRGMDTALKRWGVSLCERGGSNAKKRAIVAVARKLAVLLHKLWVSGQAYRPFPAGVNN